MQGDAGSVPSVDPVIGRDKEHPPGCCRDIVDSDRELLQVPGVEDGGHPGARGIPENRRAVEEVHAPEGVDPHFGNPLDRFILVGLRAPPRDEGIPGSPRILPGIRVWYEFLDAVTLPVDYIDIIGSVDGDAGRKMKHLAPGIPELPRFEWVAGTIKHLDAVGVRISHMNVASSVDGDAGRRLEFPLPKALRSPRCKEFAGTIELLDAVVPGVCHVDVAGSIDGDAFRRPELTVPGTPRPPRCKEFTGTIKLLDAMIP